MLPGSVWPETYALTLLGALLPCARVILECPNDLLLRPACTQKLVRVMLAPGSSCVAPLGGWGRAHLVARGGLR